jgi:cytochrome c-type biogenesis protein
MVALTPLGVVEAFAAGLASFLSPCVFPLVPGYLSYLAGTAGEEALARGERHAQLRWRVALHAVCFVCGFSLIFIALGATASTLGIFLRTHLALLRQIAGVVLILAGLQVAGIPQALLLLWERRSTRARGRPATAQQWCSTLYLGLLREHRVEVRRGEPALLQSTLIGLAFGAGWTPCIGPILGSIYTLAAASGSLREGVALLAVYSLGLGLPFLATGLLIDRAAPAFRRLSRALPMVMLGCGAMMVAMGALVLSGVLTRLAQFSPLLGG